MFRSGGLTGKQSKVLPSIDCIRRGCGIAYLLEFIDNSFRRPEEIESFLADDLKRCIEKEGYKRSEIAVIYDDKIYGPSRFAYDNRALPMRILKKLEPQLLGRRLD